MSAKPKHHGIYVYCTPEEKKLIKSAAKAARQSLSSYVLTIVLKYKG